jgi:hypothetical protein
MQSMREKLDFMGYPSYYKEGVMYYIIYKGDNPSQFTEDYKITDNYSFKELVSNIMKLNKEYNQNITNNQLLDEGIGIQYLDSFLNLISDKDNLIFLKSDLDNNNNLQYIIYNTDIATELPVLRNEVTSQNEDLKIKTVAVGGLTFDLKNKELKPTMGKAGKLIVVKDKDGIKKYKDERARARDRISTRKFIHVNVQQNMYIGSHFTPADFSMLSDFNEIKEDLTIVGKSFVTMSPLKLKEFNK